MMDEVEERYPLVGNRPNNFGMETGNGSGTRRRGNGIESSKSESQYQEEETYFSATPFNPPPPPPSDEESKYHGRNFLSWIASAIASLLKSPSSRFKKSTHENDSQSQVSVITEYYRDDFNDESWVCSFGTGENDGIWMNQDDPPGTILSLFVALLICYSSLTVILLAQTDHLSPELAMIYFTLSIMSLACHLKTTYTDPGAVPESAVPVESIHNRQVCHSMCSQCQSFKPPFSHHCRICNRCVSRMDHHCPWMNNCIGAGNMKHFILFLIYTWLGSALALIIFGWNYFLCAEESCQFSSVLVQLVRIMTIICICTLLFTSSMIMNVIYGIISGIGTIDRLKKKANNTMSLAEEEPLLLKDIFGVAGYHTWPFPVDPIFEDYDRVMGYSTPQRLLREQLRDNVCVPISIPSNHERDYVPV